MLIKNYDQAIKYIFLSENIDKKFYNIDRIRQVNNFLGNSDKKFKIIHITGTNGKGSVSKMVFSVIKNSGKKVGCFTSPHLIDIRERIVTEKGMIGKKDFVKSLNLILKIDIKLSYFELLTLIAFLYFKEKKCEYVVLETGLGGLLDATNIVSPKISCITNIGYDHLEILGPTIEDVAYNKAGIIKKGIPVVINEKNKIIERLANKNQSKIIFANKKYETNLFGEHQKTNAGLTYEICKYLGFSDMQIKKGLMKVEHLGRMQYISKNLLVDGAHNIDGIKALKIYLDSIKKKYSEIIYCFSLKKGKDASELVLDIFGQDKKYIIVNYENEKLEKISNLRKKIKLLNYEIKTPRQIKNLTKKNKKILYVVFGSLYMIGEFLN